jgi:DNA-binding XRE family transcriptional regulator/predicted RNase H-like HicB family nuclease
MHYLAVTRKEGKSTLIGFPDCPGCQTFAEPGEVVVDVARDALEGWLEVHLEGGDAPPRPSVRVRAPSRSRSLPVRVDPMLAVRLQIRWARQDAQLSQGELAARIGVTRQQVSLLESRGSNLTVGTLRKIAGALGLELDITLHGPRAA